MTITYQTLATVMVGNRRRYLRAKLVDGRIADYESGWWGERPSMTGTSPEGMVRATCRDERCDYPLTVEGWVACWRDRAVNDAWFADPQWQMYPPELRNNAGPQGKGDSNG